MKEINVNGQKRTDTGKKASKQLRKEGLVPCNLYGEKKGENGLPEAFAFANIIFAFYLLIPQILCNFAAAFRIV